MVISFETPQFSFPHRNTSIVMSSGNCPPSDRVHVGLFVFGVMIGAIIISLIVFLLTMIKKFDEIIERYNTISDYCTNPKQYGSRWLLFSTTLIAVSLSVAYVAAYNSVPSGESVSAAQVTRFILRLVAAFMFPLVGLFYVSSEEEQALDFGICQVPIVVSGWIHMISAMSYFVINAALNLWDSIIMIETLDPAAGTAWVLFSLSVIGVILLSSFVITQAVIRCLPPVDAAEMRHVLQQYRLISAKGGKFFCFTRTKDPEQIQFENEHRQFMRMRTV